ncbi:MAG: hypothetical protein ACUVWY_12885 [Desulfosoma sp.]|uniref:hypothetical protein n=1 Tax=Desulfosoma sp. TaxID=2603217 RepID=UPI00404A0905
MRRALRSANPYLYVAASHERFPLNEPFHRYCKWYELPVDAEGFLQAKEREIREDLAHKAFSLEASPHLSLSVVELYERFHARFILLVRTPHEVVSSFLKKGFLQATLCGARSPSGSQLLKNASSDVHSQFLVDPQRSDALLHTPWGPEKPRPVRISFLGCLDPKNRRGFLSSLRPLFRNPDMYWHEYTDSAEAGVTAQEYLKLLSDSDFTLCPPGYSLMTHRPLEALLRAAIPIMNEGELCLYGIELKDKVNCVAVKNHRWQDVV